MLLDDCFTTYNNPEVGIARGARAGSGGLPRRAGRPAPAAAGRRSRRGCLTLGRDLATGERREALAAARQGMPIVGCEPSCLVTLVDEYRDFRLGPAADEVAALLCWSTPSWPTRPVRPTCRSSRWRDASCCTAIASRRPRWERLGLWPPLKRIPGLEIRELDSGCCGMAGSFGYEHGHYDVSVALANRVLLAAAAAEPEARWSLPAFRVAARFTAWPGSTLCIRSSCWRNDSILDGLYGQDRDRMDLFPARL